MTQSHTVLLCLHVADPATFSSFRLGCSGDLNLCHCPINTVSIEIRGFQISSPKLRSAPLKRIKLYRHTATLLCYDPVAAVSTRCQLLYTCQSTCSHHTCSLMCSGLYSKSVMSHYVALDRGRCSTPTSEGPTRCML